MLTQFSHEDLQKKLSNYISFQIPSEEIEYKTALEFMYKSLLDAMSGGENNHFKGIFSNVFSAITDSSETIETYLQHHQNLNGEKLLLYASIVDLCLCMEIYEDETCNSEFKSILTMH